LKKLGNAVIAAKPSRWIILICEALELIDAIRSSGPHIHGQLAPNLMRLESRIVTGKIKQAVAGLISIISTCDHDGK
jgi:hypothetical protein